MVSLATKRDWYEPRGDNWLPLVEDFYVGLLRGRHDCPEWFGGKLNRNTKTRDAVEKILQRRCFSHLSRGIILGYLATQIDRERERVLVPFYRWMYSRTPDYENEEVKGREFLVTALARDSRFEGRRRSDGVWVPRPGSMDFLLFDLERLEYYIAWRLGVCCSVCRKHIGKRRSKPFPYPSTWYNVGGSGAKYAPYTVMSLLAEQPGSCCDECHGIEQRVVKKFMHDRKSVTVWPDYEWTLLSVMEKRMGRQKKGAWAKAS